MVDFWIKLKIWTEYIVPMVFLVLVIVLSFLFFGIESFKWNRKEKLLKNNGFKRHFQGGLDIYVWENKELNKKFKERDLERWKYKNISKLIKENIDCR